MISGIESSVAAAFNEIAGTGTSAATTFNQLAEQAKEFSQGGRA